MKTEMTRIWPIKEAEAHVRAEAEKLKIDCYKAGTRWFMDVEFDGMEADDLWLVGYIIRGFYGRSKKDLMALRSKAIDQIVDVMMTSEMRFLKRDPWAEKVILAFNPNIDLEA